ncbi:hypothetical protein ACJJTC_003990 [Scirpophaga incertulas]
MEKEIEILKNINDAAKILCNTCYSDTMSRRSLISAVIKKDMKESLTGDTDSFLFGSDLSEKIKITKAVQKSVKDLRINASNKPTITPKTKSLNWRAPPRSSASDSDRREAKSSEATPKRRQETQTTISEHPQRQEQQVLDIIYYIDNWKTITDDPTILSWISGYQIPFDEMPSQTNCPMNDTF